MAIGYNRQRWRIGAWDISLVNEMSDKRLYHAVAEQIATRIRSGTYPPGTRLPGERDLADELEVSRVTVREAEIALEAKGMLDIRMGSGVYVLRTSADTGSASLPDVGPFELTEARSAIESEGAAIAALSISEQDLDTLDAILAEMAAESGPGEALASDTDKRFHLTIARATGNPAMLDTVERLWRIRAENAEIKRAYDSICRIDPDLRLAEHRDIVLALRNRDADEARKAMRRHFACIIEALLRATEAAEIEEIRRRTYESRERFLNGALTIP